MYSIKQLEGIERCKYCHCIRGKHMLEDNMCFQCFFANQIKLELPKLKDFFQFTKEKKICVYCGEPAEEIEHVYPRISKMPTYTVLTCYECNRIARGIPFTSFLAKQSYIQNKLAVKYEDILNTPEWTEDELMELGYNIRTGIKGNGIRRDIIEQRIFWNVEGFFDLEGY